MTAVLPTFEANCEEFKRRYNAIKRAQGQARIACQFRQRAENFTMHPAAFAAHMDAMSDLNTALNDFLEEEKAVAEKSRKTLLRDVQASAENLTLKFQTENNGYDSYYYISATPKWKDTQDENHQNTVQLTSRYLRTCSHAQIEETHPSINLSRWLHATLFDHSSVYAPIIDKGTRMAFYFLGSNDNTNKKMWLFFDPNGSRPCFTKESDAISQMQWYKQLEDSWGIKVETK